MAYISAIAYTMIETNTDNKIDKLQTLSKFFKTGNTRDYNFRKQQLLNLKKAILDNEEELYKCLYTDLKKNREEIWVTETGFAASTGGRRAVMYSLKSDVLPVLAIGGHGIHIPYHTTWAHETVEHNVEHEKFRQAIHINEVIEMLNRAS